MSTLTIPESVVKQVHEATFYTLGKAANEIADQVEMNPPALETSLATFDQMRVLMNATSADYGADLEVDAEMRYALIDALSEWIVTTAGIVACAPPDAEYGMAARCAQELAAVTAFTAALTGEGDA